MQKLPLHCPLGAGSLAAATMPKAKAEKKETEKEVEKKEKVCCLLLTAPLVQVLCGMHDRLSVVRVRMCVHACARTTSASWIMPTMATPPTPLACPPMQAEKPAKKVPSLFDGHATAAIYHQYSTVCMCSSCLLLCLCTNLLLRPCRRTRPRRRQHQRSPRRRR